MIHDSDRLKELLGRPQLRPLIQRLRSRLRTGANLHAPLTLTRLAPAERSAIDALLSRRPSTGESLRVRPDEIERILQDARLCDRLDEALTHLLGPVTNERAVRQRAGDAWTEARETCQQLFGDLPAYRRWLIRIWSSGTIKRTAGGDPGLAVRMLTQVAGVLRGMPWRLIPLAELATQLTGDSHALDRGLPLTRLCLAALASTNEPETSRPSPRLLWEQAGVVMDELSAPVLVLNLRADPSMLIGRMLNPLAERGEPCHLSVRLLRAAGPAVFEPLRGQTVYACENPSIVAATAQRLGPRARPLICTAGQPASAAQILFTFLQTLQCRILYHGDVDPSGIRIANLMIARFDAAPWRMNATDYLRATPDGPAFAACAPAATWDPNLAPAMNASRRSLLEESVVDALLGDLRH